MAANNNSRAQDIDLKLYSISQRHRTYRTVVKTVGTVGIVYFFGKAIAPFAGEQTIMSLALNFLGDIKFTLSVTLAGAACAWAAVERHLRHRKTRYLQDRIKELELTIDPDRTTSGLDRTGKTNPRDRRK